VRPSSRRDGNAHPLLRYHVSDGSSVSLAGIMAEARPDIVLHLASEMQRGNSAADADRLLQSNVLFPVRLVEAMLEAGCRRLVNTGSFWQHYGGAAYNPVDLYAATKQALEDLLLYYHEVRGLSCGTLKLFETYGPGDTRRKLLNLLLDAALVNERIEASPGEQTLDLSHVDDVAAAFKAAANVLCRSAEPLWETGHVSGERMTLQKLVALVGDAAARGVPVAFGGLPYRAREIMMPMIPRAGPLLTEWQPIRRLREALPEMLAARRLPGN
jgi:nucleoside-diphosphate-sugar epimerase